MAEKYLIFSLEDSKSKKLGEAISNNTSKKIINFLADSSLANGISAGDISKGIGIPLNSLDYNLKKLIEAGLVERIKGFFWSSKGRKIEKYKIVNKLIVISPKKGNIYSKLKGIVPIILISSVLTGIVGMYYNSLEVAQRTASSASELVLVEGDSLIALTSEVNDVASKIISEPNLFGDFVPWKWFAIGSIVAIILFTLWNWKKL